MIEKAAIHKRHDELKKQRGFTLIEVMAAFGMFALLFGLMMQILSTSMTNTRRAGDFTQAAMWAQSKIDTLGLEEMIEPGTSRGEFDDRFRFEMEITEELVADERALDLMELPLALYKVRLVVAWEENRQVVFETLKSVDINWEARERERSL
ncbi:MAG TPA: type II secretion system protein [Wenzhouxiangella sp.]